jgi:hypothetical protein
MMRDTRLAAVCDGDAGVNALVLKDKGHISITVIGPAGSGGHQAVLSLL